MELRQLSLLLPVPFVVGLSGCGGQQAQLGPRRHTGSDEYAVYSALLDEYSEASIRHEGVRQVVIADRTFDVEGDKDIRQYLDHLRSALPEMAAETLESFRERNRETAAVEPRFDLRLRWELISAQEVEGLFPPDGGVDQIARGWQELQGRYPRWLGLVTLSRVGFGAKGTEAIVFMSVVRGGDSGQGAFYLLRKGSDGWVVRKTRRVWVS